MKQKSPTLNTLKFLTFIGLFTLFTGCTTVTVDELRWEETTINPESESIVILGRHHSPNYETEPSLVACIGKKLRSNIDGLNVVSEPQFKDLMYPWFEPRTAPLNMEKFAKTLQETNLGDNLEKHNIRYIVWIEGSTETLNQIGSMSCAFTPAGGGCFGFGSWENESDYEASIWDFKNTSEVGKISTDASGTSYLPAVVIPIPLLARVQSNACTGMGEQISNFLAPEV